MNITTLDIPDVKLITPKRHEDGRGFFAETWNRKTFATLGIHLDFVQDNHSASALEGTVRGLHFQTPPFAQTKLVRVIRGSVLDVAVDVRKGSPYFGKWVSAVLSAENMHQLLVPQGFAHGICTLEANTEVLYKVDNHYSGPHDGGLIWDDPDLAIDWPVKTAILSDKDQKLPRLAEFDSPFIYNPKGSN